MSQSLKRFLNIFIPALMVLAVVVFLVQQCSGNETIEQPNDLKNKIQEEKSDKDSIRERIVYKDRVRTEYIVKWKTLKGKVDSIPCPEALAQVIWITDTIIKADSSLIESLKAEILTDNLIISNQDTIIKRDSTQIVKLKKEVRKQKNRKKFWQAVAGGLGIIAIVK